MNRFNGQIPHHIDTNLLERCQEQLRDYDIHYKGWVEPRDHTLSYIAAAYLELAKKYEVLANAPSMEETLEAMILKSQQDALSPNIDEAFEQSVFAAQMENIVADEFLTSEDKETFEALRKMNNAD